MFCLSFCPIRPESDRRACAKTPKGEVQEEFELDEKRTDAGRNR